MDTHNSPTIFSILFVGSTHGYIDDFEKQKEIILQTKPEIVLSEQMQEHRLIEDKDYDKFLRRRKVSDMVVFEEVENLVLLCKKQKIKLIGLDYHNFHFDKHLQSVVKGKKPQSIEDEKKIEEIIKKREAKHIQTIKRYKKLTDKPVVVLLGSWHLRKESELMTQFDNYEVIYPSDEKGKILFETPKKKIKIRYLTYKKDGKKG